MRSQESCAKEQRAGQSEDTACPYERFMKEERRFRVVANAVAMDMYPLVTDGACRATQPDAVMRNVVDRIEALEHLVKARSKSQDLLQQEQQRNFRDLEESYKMQKLRVDQLEEGAFSIHSEAIAALQLQVQGLLHQMPLLPPSDEVEPHRPCAETAATKSYADGIWANAKTEATQNKKEPGPSSPEKNCIHKAIGRGTCWPSTKVKNLDGDIQHSQILWVETIICLIRLWHFSDCS